MTLRRLLVYAVIQLGGELKVPTSFVMDKPPKIGWVDEGGGILIAVDMDSVKK